MSSTIRLGFFSLLGAYGVWGLLPIYFRALDHVAPPEMLAHRIIWSVPTGLVFIALARNWQQLRDVIQVSHLRWLLLSALLIGGNWLIYIWAVGEERVMEASLGYYINPLVNVLIGAALFSESLRRAQWIAVMLASVGVAVMTIALGTFPWVALALCMSFAFYGVIRKRVQVDSRAGFVVEASILAPLAMVWMVWSLRQPGAAAFGQGGWDIPLLLLSGPITAVPLILFALGAKRLRLSTIGMMQYIAPTLQFLVATVLFREPFGVSHGIAFVFIWTALAIFTIDSVIGDRKARRLARAASAIH